LDETFSWSNSTLYCNNSIRSLCTSGDGDGNAGLQTTLPYNAIMQYLNVIFANHITWTN
jgi:hypothetical protein